MPGSMLPCPQGSLQSVATGLLIRCGDCADLPQTGRVSGHLASSGTHGAGPLRQTPLRAGKPRPVN